MLSEFLGGIAILLNLHWLFIGLEVLLFAGAVAGSRALVRGKGGFILAAALWISLFILLAVMREHGELGGIFRNPVIVGVLGLVAGLWVASYARLTGRD